MFETFERFGPSVGYKIETFRNANNNKLKRFGCFRTKVRKNLKRLEMCFKMTKASGPFGPNVQNKIEPQSIYLKRCLDVWAQTLDAILETLGNISPHPEP